MHKHILICGDIGVGKSTLVNKLVSSISKPAFGYKTLSMNKTSDGYHEIYIYPPNDMSKAKLVAKCAGFDIKVFPEIFETYGVELLSSCEDNGIIVMDEIGFMESNSPKFTSKVLELLDGDIPVIGAVKTKNNTCDYLNLVRNHSNIDLFHITKENRNSLFEDIKKGRNLL